MTKAELAAKIASTCSDDVGSKAAAGRVVDAVFEVCAEALEKGEEVSIAGFGKFKPKKRAARMARNPQTGDQIEVAARTVVTFKPASALKTRVDV